MHKSRVRKNIANTFLVLCSAIIAIALVEIGLRIIDYSYRSTWRFDRITGKALLAGAQMWNREEGQAFIQINSDGLRDEEHSLDKPENTIRIAILGDSYAEAIQVPLDKTFWKVIEDKLAHCQKFDGKQVEVINFGVSGFGTVQELLTLRTKVWKYSPDIVLLGFLTGNDIRNNLRELQGGNNQPYYVYQEGTLVLDDRFMDKTKSRIRGSALADWWFTLLPDSRVLQLLNKAYTTLDQRRNVSRRAQRKETRQSYERGLDDEIYRHPSDPAWIEAWRVTEDLLRMMNADVIERNATFMLVTLSNSGQVHPDPAERQRYADSLNVKGLLYPDKRIQHFAREEAIRSIMLVPPLQAWTEEYGECVHGFQNATPCGGHWNEIGHRLAGTIIADHICQSPPKNPGLPQGLSKSALRPSSIASEK
jgi:hypothetical protein